MITPTLANESMRYYRLAPDARLRPWVRCYWWVEPASGARVAPAQNPDLLIPDGHSELVFCLAGEFMRWQLGESASTGARMRGSYVIGGRSKSVLTRSPGGLRLAGVKLDPRALRMLLRRPLTGFRDNTVACADLGCPELLALEEKIAGLSGVDSLPEIFDRFFLRTLAADAGEDASTELLVRRIRTTHGAQPILKWAREQCLDVRTLERRFSARMGLSPKQFARIERFKHSYHRLCTEGRVPLDAYYDESHFDREFRHFMGASPYAWFRREPRFTTAIGDHLLQGELA